MSIFGSNPDSNAATPREYAAFRAITASATRMNLQSQDERDRFIDRSKSAEAWQDAAWTYYDNIASVRQAYEVTANATSRVRLFVGIIAEQNAAPTPGVAYLNQMKKAMKDKNVDASEATVPSAKDDYDTADMGINVNVDMLEFAIKTFSQQLPLISQGKFLKTLSLNLDVAGDAFVYSDPITGVWRACSKSALIPAKGDSFWKVRSSRSDGMGRQTELSPDALIGRIWKEHPRFWEDPTSALESLQRECEEHLLISQLINYYCKSRMNAGMLFIPEDLSLASKTNLDDESEGDVLENALYTAILEPVIGENAASAVAPIIIRGDADAGDKIKFITNPQVLSKELLARAASIADRILEGLDIPKDIVTGLSHVKYSNAVQIDESLYKAHVEPKCLVICDGLTEIMLRPILREAAQLHGWDINEADRLVIWYDPTEIVTRPHKSEEATVGLTNHALSMRAWRTNSGFSELDAPSEEELALRMAIGATLPPDVVSALIQQTFPHLAEKAKEIRQSQAPLPAEIADQLDPNKESPPVPSPPNLDSSTPPGAPPS